MNYATRPIPTINVQEIKTNLTYTDVPLSPDYVVGILNLRGQILLAVDLIQRLNLSNLKNSNNVSIIAKSQVGLICLTADSVGNVIEVFENDFETAYDAIEKNQHGMITGVYKLDNDLLHILNTNATADINIELPQSQVI